MINEFKKNWETRIQNLNRQSYTKEQCNNICHSFEKEKASVLMYGRLNTNEFFQLEGIETLLSIALESAYSNHRKNKGLMSRFFGIFKNVKSINFNFFNRRKK